MERVAITGDGSERLEEAIPDSEGIVRGGSDNQREYTTGAVRLHPPLAGSLRLDAGSCRGRLKSHRLGAISFHPRPVPCCEGLRPPAWANCGTMIAHL